MKSDRADFPAKTRRVIAMRSGYRCAHPECDGRTTIGPAKHAHQFENTGNACHVFAAAKRGPRGQGNLSEEELRSVSNGIWLCGQHSDQVDLNNGKDYPPPVLLSWKAAHEFRIAREHGAMLYPAGWIESLSIIDAPIFRPNQRISFAGLNVIVGDNGVGKTAICEWLGALKNSSTLQRWGAYPENARRQYQTVRVAIDFRAPAHHHLDISIEGGRPTFCLDGHKFPFSPVDYEVVSVQGERRIEGNFKGSQIYIARFLSMDPADVQALADSINESPGIFLKGSQWRDEVIEEEEQGEPVRLLYCTIPGGHVRAFGALSGGEQSAALMDLAIARARFLAGYRPTLLIIETDALTLDKSSLSLYLNALSSPDNPFQSVIVTPFEGLATWSGWQVIRLSRPNGVSGHVRELTDITVGDVHTQPT